MTKINEVPAKCGFDDALDAAGLGAYSVWMLVCNCLLLLAMYVDIFGFSVLLPAAACDLALTAAQQGLLSALPLVGVMVSSYAWGLCADTLGRRRSLLLAMPVGAALNVAAGVAPDYPTLAALKCLSACFTSSANAAGFVLVGESVPRRARSRCMFLMASATMFVQFVICCFALPVFQLSFRVEIPFLSLDYRPWRLLMHLLSLPGIIGIVNMVFLSESPKFLLSKGRDEDALKILQRMYRLNTGKETESYPVQNVFLEGETTHTSNEPFFKKMWNQTAPLFKPPLLKNSLKLYYILLTAYMTSTGYTMWVPTMTNAYFTGDDNSGRSFCDVASQATSANGTTSTDCDSVIQPLAIYATMAYSFACGFFTIVLSFLVGPLGKKHSTLLVFVVSAACGTTLLFVKIPVLSIMMFYLFLHVALILGNINTYLVELNPTHLRGMATCLSVVVARGLGFVSVQLIAALLPGYCTPMIGGYVVLVMSGFVVACFLPKEPQKSIESNQSDTVADRRQSVESQNSML